MKYLTYLIVLITSTSCTSHTFTPYTSYYVDSAFVSYASCFAANIGESLPNELSIHFDPSVTTGRCTKSSISRRTILINEFEWADMSSLQREFLIYHELGHCVLELKHDDDTFNYMNSNTPSAETIEANRHELYLDFFGEDYELCDLSFDE